MLSGSLDIVEPWVPADQLQREIVIVGRGLDDGSLLLMVDEPLGWDNWGSTQLAIVRPRHSGVDIETATEIHVNGALWGGRWKDPLRFAGTLHLEVALKDHKGIA